MLQLQAGGGLNETPTNNSLKIEIRPRVQPELSPVLDDGEPPVELARNYSREPCVGWPPVGASRWLSPCDDRRTRHAPMLRMPRPAAAPSQTNACRRRVRVHTSPTGTLIGHQAVLPCSIDSPKTFIGRLLLEALKCAGRNIASHLKGSRRRGLGPAVSVRSSEGCLCCTTSRAASHLTLTASLVRDKPLHSTEHYILVPFKSKDRNIVRERVLLPLIWELHCAANGAVEPLAVCGLQSGKTCRLAGNFEVEADPCRGLRGVAALEYGVVAPILVEGPLNGRAVARRRGYCCAYTDQIGGIEPRCGAGHLSQSLTQDDVLGEHSPAPVGTS
mmetsp:Transcript_48771/g.144106  ORF Transcript_48771/g.144106 Transcript_48771/m.144106 type:complete len:331 (-) Transcript_48771:638-1630(-)